MLTCKDTTELASNCMDSQISWQKKIGFRLHLWVCKNCRHYVKQLNFLQQAFTEVSEQAKNVVLSDAARQRIAQKLAEAQTEITSSAAKN